MTHCMTLDPLHFERMKRGEKTVEILLFDEKRRKISILDEIIFENRESGELISAVVSELHRFASFDELCASPIYPLTGFGSESVLSCKAQLRAYYSEAEEKMRGVLAILVKIKPF